MSACAKRPGIRSAGYTCSAPRHRPDFTFNQGLAWNIWQIKS